MSSHEHEGASEPAINRRQALGIIGAAGVASAALALGAAAGSTASAADISTIHTSTGSTPMKVTCIIRYEIDPFQRDAFKEYAQAWGRVIPRCGGHLVGYFLPYEGTNDVAYALIAFESLAAYEAYRAKLRLDGEGRDNFNFAQTKRFIRREERTFIESVDGTFGIPAAVGGK